MNTNQHESSDGFFGSASLSPKRSGLPFVEELTSVAIRSGAQDDVRLKISSCPHVRPPKKKGRHAFRLPPSKNDPQGC